MGQTTVEKKLWGVWVQNRLLLCQIPNKIDMHFCYCFSYNVCYFLVCRYSVVGWSIPWIPVIVALAMDQIKTDSDLAPSYGLPQCWLNSAYGLYIYFLVPLAAMFFTNFIIYVIVVVRFSILAYQCRAVRNTHHEKIILSFKLFFAFGLLWVFGILCAAFPENSAFSCLFIFINSLSGVLLLLIFLVNASVYKALKQLVRKTPASSRPSLPTTEKICSASSKNQPQWTLRGACQ